MGLCLSRREGESVRLGDMEIQVVRITEGRVYLRFIAPRTVRILRTELTERRGHGPEKRSGRRT